MTGTECPTAARSAIGPANVIPQAKVHGRMKPFVILALLLTIVAPNLGLADRIEIKIGATLPLTGPLAFIGEDIRRGIELGIEDSSSSKVSFTAAFEDDQYELKHAASTAHKLLDRDKVDAIISLWDTSDVVAPLAAQKNIPHLAIRWDPRLSSKYSSTFTAETRYTTYVDSLLQLLKTLGTTKVGLLTAETQGWLPASEYIQQAAPQFGLTVVGTEGYNAQEKDFRSVVLRLLQRKPDMIVLFSNPPEIEIQIRQIRELAPQQEITGYFEPLQDPALVEGLPFVSHFDIEQWFKEKFQRRFGNPPKSRAPHAYDIVKLLGVTVLQSGAKPDPQSILKVLSQSSNLSGATGQLTVTNTKNIESRCVWKVAQMGRFIAYPPSP